MKQTLLIIVSAIMLVGVTGCILRPITSRFDKLNTKIDAINGRMKLVNEQLADTNHGLGNVENGVKQLNKEITVLDSRLEGTSAQLKQLNEMNTHLGIMVKTMKSMDKKLAGAKTLLDRVMRP